MPKLIRAGDLFCGAGGATNGLLSACHQLGLRADVLAVDHWPVAIETHAQNHPAVRHFCEDLESVNPRKVVPGGKLDLLMAGPECTHHSMARGGKPINDQSRASAWCVLRWATVLQIDTVLIENVREFQGWGPIGSNGRPLKSRKGETFHAYLDAFRSLGYKVDFRTFNAADFGDPTTRQRLFIQCRRGRKPIVWPEPSHSRCGDGSLFGRMRTWRTAREIIDWSIPSKSVFGRKRPLSPNTLARIAAGLHKFGGTAAEPFLVLLNGGGRQGAGGAKSVDDPVPVITAGGKHIGLCEPFIVPQFSGQGPKSIDQPLGTITTTSRGVGLVEPFILPPEGVYRGNAARSLDDPLQTVTSRGGGQLVEPFIIPTTHSGGANRTHDLDKPFPTVTGAHRGEFGLVEPFILPQTTEMRCRSLDEPLPTIVGRDHTALVEPFLTKYNGTAFASGLVYDIRFRMLQPRELARAHSFPDTYQFAGRREDVVKQIGNSWPNMLGRALCLALLETA